MFQNTVKIEGAHNPLNRELYGFNVQQMQQQMKRARLLEATQKTIATVMIAPVDPAKRPEWDFKPIPKDTVYAVAINVKEWGKELKNFVGVYDRKADLAECFELIRHNDAGGHCMLGFDNIQGLIDYEGKDVFTINDERACIREVERQKMMIKPKPQTALEVFKQVSLF